MTTTSHQIGIAIIGCGYWGMNHLRVFSELPESRVVVVCDRRIERLEAAKQRFPGLEVTPKIEDTLELDDVDAVIVCTPASSHYDVTRRCLAAGKHVLVEKPMTTSVADGEELIDLAASKGVTLMVGHTFLYNAGVRKVKEWMQGAKAGQIYYLYARRTNLGPVRQDVNAFWDLASHDVSIFNYLLDSMPEWVSSVGARVLRNGREDVGFVALGYQDGIVGHIHVSWADPNKVREVVVVGSEKRIVFNDLDAMERVRIFEKGIAPTPSEAPSFGEYQFLMRDGDIISPRVEASEPLKNQSIHFIECVAQGTPPFTGGRAGLEVVQVLRAVDNSLRRRGTPVDLI